MSVMFLDSSPSSARAVHVASLAISPVPEQVGEVRHALEDLLRGWGVHAEAVQVGVLIASELTANAVVHARESRMVVVEARLLPGALRLSVRDGAGGVPRAVVSSDDEEGGRGLRLIDALADDWGFTRHRDGSKTVWATVPLGS
jgi:anti-sigma regulatory factor (Ser/Thr protein kinase)